MSTSPSSPFCVQIQDAKVQLHEHASLLLACLNKPAKSLFESEASSQTNHVPAHAYDDKQPPCTGGQVISSRVGQYIKLLDALTLVGQCLAVDDGDLKQENRVLQAHRVTKMSYHFGTSHISLSPSSCSVLCFATGCSVTCSLTSLFLRPIPCDLQDQRKIQHNKQSSVVLCNWMIKMTHVAATPRLPWQGEVDTLNQLQTSLNKYSSVHMRQ